MKKTIDYAIIIRYMSNKYADECFTEGVTKRMCRIGDVCDYVLYHAYAGSDGNAAMQGRFTNLWLQKTLYYVYGIFYKRCNKELFPANFEAWQYGPVCPEAYLRHHESGSRTPLSRPESCPKLPISRNEEDVMKDAIRQCASRSASDLVRQTHEEKPWKSAVDQAGKAGVGVEISKEVLHRFFRNEY